MNTIQRLSTVAVALVLILMALVLYRLQGAGPQPEVAAVEDTEQPQQPQQPPTLTPSLARAESEPATPKPRPTAAERICEVNVEAFLQLSPPEGDDSIYNRPPIPYITFHLVEENNKVPPMALKTDLEGKVSFHQNLPGCPKVSFTLYPDVPHGYAWASPDKYDGITGDSGTVTFDFVFMHYQNQPHGIVPTPMPAGQQPKIQVNTEQGPTCEAVLGNLQNSPKYADFLALGPNGSVWVNDDMEESFKLYQPGADTWKEFTVDDGLEHQYGFYSIEVSPDGILWIGTQEGVSSYDGSTWRSYDGSISLSNGMVGAIGFGKDGRVWFATYGGGVSSFNPSSGEWHTYDVIDPLGGGIFFTSVFAAEDGSIWFGTAFHGAIRLRFPSGDPNEPEWFFFLNAQASNIDPSITSHVIDFPLYENYVSDIEQAADGTLWFGSEGVLGFAAEAQQYWLIGETSFYVGSLEVAPNGTLWAATDVGLVHIYPDRDPRAPDAWTTYDFKEIEPRFYISDIEVVDDQNIWIVFNGVPMLCNFP